MGGEGATTPTLRYWGPFDPCKCGHARPDHYDGIGMCMAEDCGCEGMVVAWGSVGSEPEETK